MYDKSYKRAGLPCHHLRPHHSTTSAPTKVPGHTLALHLIRQPLPCPRDRFTPIISTRAKLPVEIRIPILRRYPQPFLELRVVLGFDLDTNSDSGIYSEYDSDSKDAPTPQPITWPPPRSLAQPTKLQHSAIPSLPLWPTQPLVHLVRENSPSKPKRTLPDTEEGPNGQAPVVLKYRAR